MTVDPNDPAAVDRLIAKSRRVAETPRRRMTDQQLADLARRVGALEAQTIPADQVQLVTPGPADPAPTVLPRVERPTVDPPPAKTPPPRPTSKTPRLDAIREREAQGHEQQRDRH